MSALQVLIILGALFCLGLSFLYLPIAWLAIAFLCVVVGFAVAMRNRHPRGPTHRPH